MEIKLPVNNDSVFLCIQVDGNCSLLMINDMLACYSQHEIQNVLIDDKFMKYQFGVLEILCTVKLVLKALLCVLTDDIEVGSTLNMCTTWYTTPWKNASTQPRQLIWAAPSV